jgi:hypothetical protein
LILDCIEESFVSVFAIPNEFLLVGSEFQELIVLSPGACVDDCFTLGLRDVERRREKNRLIGIEEESFDGMIGEGKMAKVVSIVDSV